MATGASLLRSAAGGARLATVCVAVLSVGSGVAPAAAKGTTVALQPVQQRQLAPEFALKDAAGMEVRLADYRKRVVLLDFWATKCGGCVEEIPWFVELTQTFAARGLTTLGVSEDIAYENLNGPDEAWRLVKSFIRNHGVPYAILMGDRDVAASYGIKALPLTCLVDRRGRIAARYPGVVDRADLQANIRIVLAERSR